MILYVKNKIVSFGGSSFVEDDMKNRCFRVKGAIFSPTRKKKIYDMDGNLLYVVRNKFWKLFTSSVFIIDPDGNRVGTLGNRDLDFRNKFVLAGATDDITISGNLIQFPSIKLEITKNGRYVGTLLKEFTIVRDSFRIDVEDSEDAAFMVALVVGIDNIYDRRSR